MGAAGSPGNCSNFHADKVLDLAHVERCSNFCGERRCRVACTLQRVVIWRRRTQQSPGSAFTASVCVELEPLGVLGKKQRSEAGVRQSSCHAQAGGHGKECWVWGVPAPPSSLTAASCGTSGGSAPSASQPGRLEFEVAASSQLALRVLQIQGPWLLGSGHATAELLGESHLRVSEDILPFCTPSERSSGACGGERYLPLTLGNRICGQVEMTMTSSSEDILVEFGGVALPSSCGSCSDDAVLPPLWAGQPKPWNACDRGELSIDQPRADPGLPIKGHLTAAKILGHVREEPSQGTSTSTSLSVAECISGGRLGCANPRRGPLSCLSCAARQ